MYGRDALTRVTRETTVAARVTQVLEDTNNMLGLMRDNGYGATLDGLRESVTACARTVESSLGFDARAFEPVASLPHGHVSVRLPGFELEDARRRAHVIGSYRQELVRRNCRYGFWFSPRLFPAGGAAPWHRGVFRAVRSGSRRWRRFRSRLAPREA